ncbi:cytochrome c oxidase subunit I [Inmirania thermothiophila]|uniref:cytochrome-c oxidase n=1 Tax=Inmirania thermothiophila TaxID=1750597 RepID=A0A3N1Y1T5_9GAMM|nr:cytochrome c oxidase subunit 1 [Inmirania thermothiophila]ROR32779.1 cytochrome c oxidase subunit 1 [Inmirania thermothiophila]
MSVASHTVVHEHEGPPRGIRRWLYSTNHKDIGTMYLVFALTMLFLGGASAMAIRAELMLPGLQLLEPDLYNNILTNHALIMIFGAVMPAGAGIANWMIPLMIGAPDIALPRINNLSFWLLPAAALMLVLSFVVPLLPGGGTQINTGWTLYPPLSVQVGMSMDFLIFAIHLLGISSVLASINIIVTILNMRAPGMTLMRMPMFCWAWLVTAFLLILVVPVLAGGVTMLLFDRHFGTSFFNAAGGGDPVLFQHLFWFFGHPEVYVLILPAIGALAEVIPTFARKPLFGYHSMVGAMIVIATLGLVVWAHHQYTVGMALGAVQWFMIGTILISIPVGLIIFNFIATMWRGALTFETPMLFAIAMVMLFSFGGLTGVMLAVVPADVQYHDSMFVVAHFHYVLIPGAIYGLLAAVFYWLPKWTGHMYDERLAKIFFWINVVSFNVTFFPQHFLGLAGMPRRIADYNVAFADFNFLSSIGAFVFGLSHLLFLYIVVKAVRGGRSAEARVWDGARGLEWELPSSPPFHSWETAPRLRG